MGGEGREVAKGRALKVFAESCAVSRDSVIDLRCGDCRWVGGAGVVRGGQGAERGAMTEAEPPPPPPIRDLQNVFAVTEAALLTSVICSSCPLDLRAKNHQVGKITSLESAASPRRLGP